MQSTPRQMQSKVTPAVPRGQDFKLKGDPPHWLRQLFLEPLIHGWKREVVIRGTPMKTRKADIYYFAPDGAKFRSRREIGQYLERNNITKYSPVMNFWFNGKILGGEFAPYETVRNSYQPSKKVSRSSKTQTDSPQSPPLSEQGMIFDEEIEIINSGERAVFDSRALPSVGEPTEPMTLPIVRENYEGELLTSTSIDKKERTPVTVPKKRKQSPCSSNDKSAENNPYTTRRYCICNAIINDQMLYCSNTYCEIGAYHFKCLKLHTSPASDWYCPICRGASSDVMNPAYGYNKKKRVL